MFESRRKSDFAIVNNRAERPRHRLAKLGPTTFDLSAALIITIGLELDKKMAPGY